MCEKGPFVCDKGPYEQGATARPVRGAVTWVCVYVHECETSPYDCDHVSVTRDHMSVTM